MSKPFVPKVGTTAECAAFTGLKNEVVIDEEKGSLIVHDGVTAGGAHEILPKAKNDELYASKGSGVTSVNDETGAVYVKKLIMGEHVLGLQEDGTLMLDANTVITSAGGTVNGETHFNSGVFFLGGLGYDNRSYIVKNTDGTVFFENWRDGSMDSRIVLRDSSASSHVGWLELRAKDKTQSSELLLTPNGHLFMANKEVERVNSSGDGYIRYESGIQICWGAYQVSSGTQVSEVIFPVPFLNKSSYVPNANSLTKGNINLICVRDANSANGEKMTVQAYLKGNTSAPTTNYYVAWSARGKWK